jgi:lipopolysaccharide/colanic/teichoic acid biosynthesis glycosyltransferase
MRRRSIDILVSLLALLFLTPVFLYLTIRIKIDSSGDIIYKQKRIGINGKEFLIYKFRSMYDRSEISEPKLACINDSRITDIGKRMRKYRIDELPQFWNVLRGDMTLVGPRPERKFFIDQIEKIAPDFMLLLKVKPGITSYGMVKYGYANTVDQMVKRMNFDLYYIKHRSLRLDLKILFFTVQTICNGKGI